MQCSGLTSGAYPLLIAAAVMLAGCEVDRVPFSRLDEGKKFVEAGDPFQAVRYFEESITRESNTAPAARAYLVVACDLAAQEVQQIPEERQKYLRKRDGQLVLVGEDPTALAHLVAILERHDLSSESAQALLNRIGPAAVPALLDAYARKPSEEDRILAVLRDIGVSAVPLVAEVLVGTALAVPQKMHLVRLLGDVGGPESRALLDRLRADEAASIGVRTEAAAGLYRLGQHTEREFLLSGLDSSDPLVREAAAFSTSFMNDPADERLLLAHIDDESATVRRHLVRALGVHHTSAAGLHALVEVLRHDLDHDVANVAVGALTRYGPAVLEPVLEQLPLEADWVRRQRLVQALGHPDVLAGLDQDSEYRLWQWFEEGETNADVKAALARLLKDLES